MDILALLRGSPGAQAWMAQQGPALGALGISPREQLDREMSYDGSHPRQQEQAAINAFRGYGPQMLMDAFIPGYGAGGDAKAASEAYGEGRYGAAAGNALMAAMDFVPVLGALPAAAKGIRAFHGSPHDFDRFDMSKIGTGEGAQAYGHGLYFADNERVARNYRDNLTGNAFGTPFVSEDVRGWVDAAGGDWGKAAADAKAYMREYGDLMSREEAQTLREAILLLEKKRESWGRMYEVNINADPEAFLDWDKPLSEQPRVAERLGMATRSEDDINKEAYDLMTGWVARDGDARWMDDPQRRAIIDKLQNELDNIAPPVTGESFYRSGGQGGAADLAAMMGGRDVSAAAAKRLRDAGIPGIKYLDAGSRGAGDGSRNYVVFDDRLITILRKYGIGGLIAGGGAYALTDAEYAQAAELLAQDGMGAQ